MKDNQEGHSLAVYYGVIKRLNKGEAVYDNHWSTEWGLTEGFQRELKKALSDTKLVFGRQTDAIEIPSNEFLAHIVLALARFIGSKTPVETRLKIAQYINEVLVEKITDANNAT